MSGKDKFERASISALLQEAMCIGLIDNNEFANLEHARMVRNPVTHFRRPGHNDTVEYHSVEMGEAPYLLIEEDAKHVMETALHLLGKDAI